MEIENIVRKTRKHLTITGIHHPKADVNRLHIKRQNGGRGLVNLETTHNNAIVGLSEGIKQDEDRLAKLVQEYDAGKADCSLQKEANLIKQKYMIQKSCYISRNNRSVNFVHNEKLKFTFIAYVVLLWTLILYTIFMFRKKNLYLAVLVKEQ